MRVGLIGTGLMGAPMAARLIEAGHDVTVHNRTREKTAPLAARGATVADDPAAVLTGSEATVLMLTDADAVAAVLAPGGEPPDLSGRAVLQMSTIAPDESRDLAALATRAGGAFVEAPVLGSIPQAEAGELIVMVGASEELFAAWRPLLSTFGPDPVRLGDVGKATAAKLALNQLIASLTTAFSFSLGLVREHGVDVEQFMEILRRSALYAPTFDKKLDRMLERDFDTPHFPVRHLLKDVELALGQGRTLGLGTASLAGVRSILAAAVSRGLADRDYSALYEAVHPAKPRA